MSESVCRKFAFKERCLSKNRIRKNVPKPFTFHCYNCGVKWGNKYLGLESTTFMLF